MRELRVLTRGTVGAAVTALSVLAAAPAMAQNEDAPPKPYVYGIYYECDVARQELADEIVDLVYAPSFDAAVEAGTIQAWGWLAHHTGSTWRRLMYHAAPDLPKLLAALDTIMAQVDEKNPEMGRAFTEICGRHDDYIWQGVAGSRGGDLAVARGKAVFSVYLECEMDEEGRADELMSDVFAPIYDRQVASGNLKSWGWMTHVVGGEWRRLLTMTADTHAGLLETRGAIIQEMTEQQEAASAEFDGICDSHQDYMWDIVHEKP